MGGDYEFPSDDEEGEEEEKGEEAEAEAEPAAPPRERTDSDLARELDQQLNA